jgi:peroxiredoxin
MKKQRLVIRTVILLLLGAMLAYAIYEITTEDKSAIIKKGDKAPDFLLQTLDENNVQLSNLKGDGILLNFWATYCPPCEKEMPYLESQYQKNKGQGVHILAINVGENKFNVQNFVDKYNLSFPILLDQTSEVVDAYGVNLLPVTYLINSEGIVIDVIPGGMTEEHIEEYLNRVKP